MTLSNLEMIDYHKGILQDAKRTMALCEDNNKESSLLYRQAKRHKRIAENCLAKL